MNNKKFVHLHLHSEKSLLDGYGSAKTYIRKAKELGFNYIACTDHGSIDNLITWQKECDKQNIHPVLGCEAYIVPDRLVKQKEERGHISILIRNETGYNTLCSILTEANLTGFYHKPRIDYNLLLNSDLSGLIIMTACAGSFLNLPESEFLLKSLSGKTSVYFEIMPHCIEAQHAIHKTIKTLSKKYPEIPLVATNDCHYIEKDEWEAQEMLLAINSRAKWDDPKRWKFGFKGLYLRTADEMLDAFKKQKDWSEEIVKQAMKNTIKIARQCFQFRIPKQEISLPEPPLVKTGASEKELLNTICMQNCVTKFGTWTKEYRDRYEEEFQLIKKKKFERYFLIVYDLINWARDNNIAVGPGRGSVGGSLISFLMGITQVDPIKFNLSFSRFISEDRGDWPDIDIDFEKRYRDKVVEYLKNTYGEYHTCGISTDMKMQSKAAIRDVCRVMEIPSIDANTFAKSVWQGEHNNDSAVQSSIDNTKEGKYFAKKYPKAIKLILKMEGQVRGSGAHAAAVVISKEDLSKSNKCVLVKRNKRLVCNWNMQDSEYAGLMKLDVLGLSTLSVLSETKRLINKKDNPEGFYFCPEKEIHLFINCMARELEERYEDCKQIDFDFNKIPLEDEETFKMISDGKTPGMFQLSGHSCTELCKKMKIHSFEDIVAIVALARPGPADSGMTDEYVARKHGGNWKSMHPIYEEVTKNTYGLLVYQEQIMQIISKVAGLSESVADKIRKIVGKKRDPGEFKPYWEQFLQGCKKEKTLSKKEAEEFWEGLLKWASYGFNRSHSVAYALIAYWTAYCVDGTTILYDWDNKKYVTIAKAFRQGINTIACYDENIKKTIGGKVQTVIKTNNRTNKKMSYTVITKSFKHLRCSIDHKILTPQGYRRLSNLSVGDLVAVEKRLSHASKPENKIKISKATKQKWDSLNKDERQKRISLSCSKGGIAVHTSGAWERHWNSLSPKEKKERTMSWLAAGTKSNRGWQSRFTGKAKDGHFVFSSNELALDNWLFENKIPHEVQVSPDKKNKRYKADFYCKGVFIEFDGMGRKEEYFEKKFKDKPYIIIRKIEEIPDKLHFLMEEDDLRQGQKIIFEPIVKIEKWGKRVMYDIIMEKEPHNFLANGVVVHNCKAHCPKEFYAASLTYGEWNEKSNDKNKHKNSLLAEIRQKGYSIIPPKRKYSSAIEWQFHGKKLYISFVEIAGIGEGSANKCLEPIRQNKIQGFFGDNYDLSAKNETKLDLLLKELKVDSPDKIPSNKILSKYLPHIDLQGGKEEQYPNLIKLLDWFYSNKYLDDWLHLDILKSNMPHGFIQRKRFRLEKPIYQCNRCDLRNRSHSNSVTSSCGTHNISICGEAPGITEVKKKIGFVGSAGQVLWNELAKYNYTRRLFHITNACKCFPGTAKTPSHSEIDLCYKWLSVELEQLECKLILVCGNAPLYALTGRKGGITNISGTTEWIEGIGKEGAWVCFCVHPSAVLRDPNNKVYFEKGIKNFTRCIELLK